MNKRDFNIKIKKRQYNKNDLLSLELEGKDINFVTINTIRRVCYNNIPIYTFDPNLVKITNNTSVYNNDYMRLRISNLEIDIENDEKNIENSDILREIEETSNDDIDSITMYCNNENNNTNIKNITTDHCVFYKNGNQIENPYKMPNLICKLKQNEKLQFSATTSLGVGIKNGIYTPCCCYYEEINDNKFILNIESICQLSELDILIRGCIYIKNKLSKIKDYLVGTNFTKNNKGDIILKNENHTIGNIITYGIQDHNNIEFCGYKLNHLLIEEVTISYMTDGAKSINIIINETMSKQINKFDHILNLIKKIK
jgi:DNA-directed RNA polymerase subunit L